MFTCTLNQNLKTPLAGQLETALREAIMAGTLQRGERLPSKRALAQHLGVSTSTIEAAYGSLTAEGWCESRPRSGIYVAADLPLPERQTRKAEPQVRWDFGTDAADATHFPYATWARLMREVLSEQSGALLRAGDPRGSEGLRRELAGMLLRMRGMEVDPETLVLGAGTEVLVSDLLALYGRERLYAVEDPGYPRVRRTLAAGGARIVPIQLTDGAMDVRALYASGAGAAYVTPSHQFPTGREMSAAQRAAILQWAKETGGALIEDDCDGEFRFTGENLRPLRALEPRVVYLNTFSRMLAPGLRMGFMALPESMVGRYREMRAACSVPAFEQETLRKFIAGGYLERHVERMRVIGRERLRALEQGVARCRLGRLSVCAAGLYALLEVSGGTPADQLVPRAREAGIRLSRLADYSVIPPHGENRTVLLGFAGLDEQGIAEGLAALAAAWGIV